MVAKFGGVRILFNNSREYNYSKESIERNTKQAPRSTIRRCAVTSTSHHHHHHQKRPRNLDFIDFIIIIIIIVVGSRVTETMSVSESSWHLKHTRSYQSRDTGSISSTPSQPQQILSCTKISRIRNEVTAITKKWGWSIRVEVGIGVLTLWWHIQFSNLSHFRLLFIITLDPRMVDFEAGGEKVKRLLYAKLLSRKPRPGYFPSNYFLRNPNFHPPPNAIS